jgi:hypothetical protein
LHAEYIIVSSRTAPNRADAATTDKTRRKRFAHPIPTIEEAKRRLAAAAGRPEPWLTMSVEDAAAVAKAEEEAGGWLLGPAT